MTVHLFSENDWNAQKIAAAPPPWQAGFFCDPQSFVPPARAPALGLGI
jgi:hypothetical protein